MKSSPAPACLPALAALLLFGACRTTDSSAGDLGVTAVQFQDVVVPSGMTLVDQFKESHSNEVAGWRFGHFEYVGGAQIQEACSHVLDRMPQHSWKLTVDESPNDAERKLVFERGRYAALYELQRVDGVTHMTIDYRTQIGSR